MEDLSDGDISIPNEDNRSELKWGPIFEALETHLRTGDELLLVISPFIGLEALKRFFEKAGPQGCVKVIVRWRPEDLRNGVSDIAIFPYLAEKSIPLYVNPDIHLKLYAFESNIALSSSGNLTLRGFGYAEKPNIEVGAFVQLTQEDWSRIYELIANSKQVDENLYRGYKEYLEKCPKAPAPPIAPPDILTARKAYTISSLPATETPKELEKYYFAPNKSDVSPDALRRAAHDIVTFGLPRALSLTEFNERLGYSFRSTRFIVEFVEFLRAEQSLRFGAVNEWIHQRCEDVPLPYRWEIKDNTRILYNWLEYFFPEITWDRPKFSQVIYWQEK